MITRDVDLRPLNTFSLPARAAFFVTVDDPARVPAVLADPALAGLPRLILGGGSNIVFDGDFSGVVLKIACAGRRLLCDDEEAWIVEAGAGENWHDFVRWTLEQGWAGLENLALIPGTVGAAPVQNIGAYGLEMAERFESLDALDLSSGEMHVLRVEDCAFGYRDSRFKREPGRWLIARVRFRLPRRWQARIQYAELARELDERTKCAERGCRALTPQTVADAVATIRRRKLPDPAEIGNAGSFFKNPVVDAASYVRLAAVYPQLPHYPQADGSEKLAAGWLIEQAGWKGRRMGPVACFERQALVLVNLGGARGADVRRIAHAVGNDVEERFGVRLEVEPVFV